MRISDKVKSLLMSTAIIAPLAVSTAGGIQQAFADNAYVDGKPTKTKVVIHKVGQKYNESTTDGNNGSDSITIEGDGEKQDVGSDWGPVEGAQFNVWKIGDFIELDKGIPKFITTIGDELDKYIEIVENTGGTYNQKSDGLYSYKIKAGVSTSDLNKVLEDLNENLDTENKILVNSNPLTTVSDGKVETVLDNNDTYIITESYIPDEFLDSKAYPIVIELPRLKPRTADKDNNGKPIKDTWFDEVDALHIYPKNFSDVGKITVDKISGEKEDDNKKIAGVNFALLSTKPTDEQIENLKNAFLGELIIDGKKISVGDYVKVIDPTSEIGTTADSDGQYKSVVFEDLTPGKIYYIIEIGGTNSKYLYTPQVKEVTLSRRSDKDDVKDNVLAYDNAKVTFENFDTPTLHKSIDADGGNDGTLDIEEYQKDDKTIGTYRGERIYYRLAIDIPQNITDYSIFSIKDILPKEVDLEGLKIEISNSTQTNEDLMKIGNGSHTADIKDNPLGIVENGKIIEGYHQAKLKSFHEGMHTIPGVTGEGTEEGWIGLNEGSVDGSGKITIGTNKVKNDLVTISGKDSHYEYKKKEDNTEDNRTIDDKTVADGELNIVFEPAGIKLLGKNKDYNKLIITYGVATNGAAQSGTIENKATLSFNPFEKDVNGKKELSDQSSTFVAGWEIVKTKNEKYQFDETGVITNPLKGAGFVLSKEIINEEGETQTVYFAHSNADGGHIMESDSHMPMGDIEWVTSIDNATVHLSGDDGYLQYCGLDAGEYTLIETITPKGYKKADDVKFTLSDSQGDKNDNGQITGTGIINGIASDDDLNVINYSKANFPITGGIGAIIFIIMGGTLIVISQKKNKKDK